MEKKPPVKTQEEEIRELIYKLQLFQAESESLQQQASLIELSLNEIESTIQTLNSMDGVKPGQEVIVPIGAGAHIYANIARLDKIVVNIGAGISIEKNIEETKKFLEKRRDELRRGYEQVISNLNAVTAEIQKLQQEAQKYRGNKNV
ncbi:MAG: prefoldin subunit alpha [Methanocellales archaeon]